MYVPARKMYQKQPVPPTVLIAQLVDLLRLVPSVNRPGLALLPTTATVKGRPAYVIELKPTPPPKAKPDELKKYNAAIKQFKQYPRFMIDKQTYNLLEYTLATTTATAQVDLTSQVFGGAIPASAFAFAPPAGAKEYKPAPGGPGGAPGMPPGGIGVTPGGRPK
jgi:outer membrane lipoprotein-sorting protein